MTKIMTSLNGKLPSGATSIVGSEALKWWRYNLIPADGTKRTHQPHTGECSVLGLEHPDCIPIVTFLTALLIAAPLPLLPCWQISVAMQHFGVMECRSRWAGATFDLEEPNTKLGAEAVLQQPARDALGYYDCWFFSDASKLREDGFKRPDKGQTDKRRG